MEITILASGSKGNATFIRTEHTSLLIDAGVTYRQIKLRMQEKSPMLQNLDGVLLTHEHSDHTKGLYQTIKNTNAPLYTSKETYSAIKNTLLVPHEYVPIIADRSLMFSDLIITPIKTSHDVAYSLGFIIQNATKRLVYITDTGFLQEDEFHKIENADAYIMEANYDVAMLFDSPRPYYLKKRIDSVKGHLSNADSAYYLTQLIGENTKTIVLAHPSQECNTESCALNTLHDVFKAYDKNPDNYDIHIAKQHEPIPTIKL